MNTRNLFDRFYYSDPSFVDGTTQFHHLCRKHIPTASRILEIGPGPSNPTSEFLASIGSVVGVDVSDEIRDNNSLSASCVYDGRVLPFRNACFDACVSDYVLEHIQHPALHFQEVARVLKPAAVYCFRTPNLWHYVTLGSKLLPHSVHLKLANRLRGLPSHAHDPYPALYRANTPRTIKNLCQGVPLEVLDLAMIEKEPSYGRSNAGLFFLMMAYERLVNSCDCLKALRANIFGVLKRAARLRPAAR